MLFESQVALTSIFGPLPHAFVLFCLGYLSMLFSERWVRAITTKQQSNGYEDETNWLQDHGEIVKGNNVAALTLVLACTIEGFFSAMAMGAQLNISALINTGLMLVFSEWVQMFIFSFKFQQCKSDMMCDHVVPMVRGSIWHT